MDLVVVLFPKPYRVEKARMFLKMKNIVACHEYYTDRYLVYYQNVDMIPFIEDEIDRFEHKLDDGIITQRFKLAREVFHNIVRDDGERDMLTFLYTAVLPMFSHAWEEQDCANN